MPARYGPSVIPDDAHRLKTQQAGRLLTDEAFKVKEDRVARIYSEPRAF
jgi:hypothetical protein